MPAPDLGSASSRVKYSELEKRVAKNRIKTEEDDGSTDDGSTDLKRSYSNPLFDNSELFLKVTNLKSESPVYSQDPVKLKKRQVSSLQFPV